MFLFLDRNKIDVIFRDKMANDLLPAVLLKVAVPVLSLDDDVPIARRRRPVVSFLSESSADAMLTLAGWFLKGISASPLTRCSLLGSH